MTVRDTSLEAYEDIQEELGDRQKLVLKAIMEIGRPVSDKYIAEYLSKSINSITGRRNELVEQDLVYEVRKGESEITGRKVIKWYLSRKGVKIGKNLKPTKDMMEDEVMRDLECPNCDKNLVKKVEDTGVGKIEHYYCDRCEQMFELVDSHYLNDLEFNREVVEKNDINIKNSDYEK